METRTFFKKGICQFLANMDALQFSKRLTNMFPLKKPEFIGLCMQKPGVQQGMETNVDLFTMFPRKQKFLQSFLHS